MSRTNLYATIAVFAYFTGGLFTNAYCQVHRWSDWGGGARAKTKTLEATCLWPVYWSSRVALSIVGAFDHTGCSCAKESGESG
jgi:hypothetical protein